VSCSSAGVVVLWDMTPVGLYSFALRMETAGVSPENTGTCSRGPWPCKQVYNVPILTCSMLSADQDKNRWMYFSGNNALPLVVLSSHSNLSL